MQLVPKTYTVRDISKELDVPATTIRTWEKSLEGILAIPRDSKGNRYYTDYELNLLNAVKSMREIGLGFDYIRENLHNDNIQKEIAPIEPKNTQMIPQQFLDELTSVIRKQITDELKGDMERLQHELEVMKQQAGATNENMENHMRVINGKMDEMITESRAERQARETKENKKWWKFWRD